MLNKMKGQGQIFFGQGHDVFIWNLFFFKWKFVVIFLILIMTSYGYSNVFLM